MPFNDDQKNAIAALLPKYISPERFLSLCLVAERSRALQVCTPQSVVNCFIQAAEVALEPNTPLGHCWLVPYEHEKTRKTYAQLIIGWRGLVHRASMASGARVEAHVVHAGEHIEWRPTDRNMPIVHTPHLDADDDDIDSIVGAYSIAFLANGETQAEWMSRTQIDRICARAKSKKGPWFTDFSEMARKCPTRRLSKYLRLTGDPDAVARFSNALRVDNLSFEGTDEPEDADRPPAHIAASPSQTPPPNQEKKTRGRPPTQNKPQGQPANVNSPTASAVTPPAPQSASPALCGFCHKSTEHDFNSCPENRAPDNSGVGQQDKPADLESATGGSNPPPGSTANGDRTISAAEYDDLFNDARKMHPNRTATWLADLLQDNFGLNDLGDLKVSQIGMLTELMKASK